MQLFICAVITALITQCTMANLGTLRTFQAAACDDDAIHLKCPPGTRIAVELARYGRVANQQHICPSLENRKLQWSLSPTKLPDLRTCLVANVQQTIVKICQTKSECHFKSNSSIFQEDPCRGQRKYIEIAYKCRPYEFRSRLACQDDRMRLTCNTNSRIAIFTAIFGRGKDDKSCSSIGDGVKGSCFSSYATQTAMQQCHGKRMCELIANATTFGQPCKENLKVNLKVIYTCVPRKVLTKQYEARMVELTNIPRAVERIPHAKNKNLGSDLNDQSDQVYFYGVTTELSSNRMLQNDTSTILNQQEVNCTIEEQNSEETKKAIGFLTEWINTYTFVAQNQERFYLYLILSIGLGILLCMSLLIAYLLVQRHKARRDVNYRLASYGGIGGGGSILPHGFADDISVVDADIDLDLPVLPMRQISNMALNIDHPLNSTIASAPDEVFRGCHTLPRDMPRSLNARGNSSFYYG